MFFYMELSYSKITYTKPGKPETCQTNSHILSAKLICPLVMVAGDNGN